MLATHCHHMGLIPDLMKQGVKLLLIDAKQNSFHFSDCIFDRGGLPFEPIDETQATFISSTDSVSLVLDSGNCLVGDLEPMEYLEVYPVDSSLRSD